MVKKKGVKKVIVKEMGVLSLAKIQALVMGAVGLIIGLVYGVILSISLAFTVSPLLGFGLGLLFIIAMPLFYAGLGFVFGALGAFLYNFIADKIGGVELKLKE